jgi:CO dehydrogenase maturation factor
MGELLADRDADAGDLVVDMEAGLEHLSRGTTRHVDVLLAVAEPYYRSMETARRICGLADELGIPEVRLVANKVRDAVEADALEAFAERHGLRIAARIDYDDAVRQADLQGRSLLDLAGEDTPAVRGITGLMEALVHGRI